MNAKASREDSGSRKPARQVRFSEKIGQPRPTNLLKMSREKLQLTPQQGRSPGQLSGKKSSMSKLREMSKTTRLRISSNFGESVQRSTELRRKAVNLGFSRLTRQEKSFERVTKVGECNVKLVESIIKPHETINQSTDRLHISVADQPEPEVGELQRLLHKKQEELSVLKQLHSEQRQRLSDLLEKADRDLKESDRARQEIQQREKDLNVAVSRLQREIVYYQAQCHQRNPLTEGRQNSEMGRQLPSKQDCQRLKQNIERLERKLRNSEQQNIQYQAMVCDLHLQRRFLREQLDNSGYINHPEFQRAEQKMLRAQAHRKKLLL